MSHIKSAYPAQPLADTYKPWCVLWLQSKGPFQFYDRDRDLVSDTTVDWNVFHRDKEEHLLSMSIEESSDRVLLYDAIRPGNMDEYPEMPLWEQFIRYILDYCIHHKKVFEVPSVYDKGLWGKFGLPIKTSEKDTIYVTPEELEIIRNNK